MASRGYGYSRSEIVDMISNNAIFLGTQDKEHPLTLMWFRVFIQRWPELKLLTPRGLEINMPKPPARNLCQHITLNWAKSLTGSIESNRPERINNVDEKVLSNIHKPPLQAANLSHISFKNPCHNHWLRKCHR
ncbi:hypothetical protein DPMN_085616 [Dreissena polymorpha]|uniref:Uncharacterized protein n=1 Tax=Dreissena polymorpha TaxID=45954 RepID=A0A9D3YGF0_DREPO|nr:hypothetical protein DPMN_085616 [Dreissena polymorpha]